MVLGIDAAWTERGSSGLALLRVERGSRAVLAVAPSYVGFIGLAAHAAPDWRTPPAGIPEISELLQAAAMLGGEPVDVVAIDMPISRRAVVGRRPSDQAVSRSFGAYGAAVHSPSAHRPDGAVTRMARGFEAAGFPIATMTPLAPALIEVFPLAALVQLLCIRRRPEYKVAKISRYRWPGPLAERLEQLLANWRLIVGHLEREVGFVGFDIPQSATSAARLKPYEDALDAIVCAWVGACYLEGTA
ncbi:MAG: DUF429 domain-containing protein, partial [Acetobacteraceae bacterium]|nr:DUF429 domain-containing protein [Acetobacteraceae bacterium]